MPNDKLIDMTIHEAIESRNKNAILLACLDANNGDDLNAFNDEGDTPLMHAIKISNNEAIHALLLASKPDNLNHKGADGNTAIHLAASDGDTILVHRLTERGADVNIMNADGKTPLDVVNDRLADKDSHMTQTESFLMAVKNHLLEVIESKQA